MVKVEVRIHGLCKLRAEVMLSILQAGQHATTSVNVMVTNPNPNPNPTVMSSVNAMVTDPVRDSRNMPRLNFSISIVCLTKFQGWA